MKNYKSSVSMIALCALLSVPAHAGLFDNGDEVYAEDIQPSSKVQIIDETKDAVQAESDSVVYIPPEKAIEIPNKSQIEKDETLFNRLDKTISDTSELVDSSEKKVDLMAKEVKTEAQQLEILMKQKSKEELDMMADEAAKQAQESVEEMAETADEVAKEIEETTFLTPSSQVPMDKAIEQVEEVEELDTKAAKFTTPRDRAEELKKELLQDLNDAKETRQELLGTSVVEREIPEASVVEPEMVDNEEAEELAKNKVAPAVKEVTEPSGAENAVTGKPLTAEERHTLEEADKSRALIARIIAEGKARKARKREEEIQEREQEAKKAVAKENRSTILRAPRWSKTPSEEKAESLFSRLEDLKHKPVEVASPDVERVDAVVAEKEAQVKDVTKDIQLTEPAKGVNVRDLYKVTKVQDRDMALPDVSSEVAISKQAKLEERKERHAQPDAVPGQHMLDDSSMILDAESFLLLPELKEDVRKQPNKVGTAPQQPSSQSGAVTQKKTQGSGLSNAIAALPGNMTVNPDRMASLTPERRQQYKAQSFEEQIETMRTQTATVPVDEALATKDFVEQKMRMEAGQVASNTTTGAPLSITDRAPIDQMQAQEENVYTTLPTMRDPVEIAPVYDAPNKELVSSRQLMEQTNAAQDAVESRLHTIANQRRIQEAARQYEMQQQQGYIPQPSQKAPLAAAPTYAQQPQPAYVPPMATANRPRYYYIPTMQPQQRAPMQQAQYYQMAPAPVANAQAQMLMNQQRPAKLSGLRGAPAAIPAPVATSQLSATQPVSVNTNTSTVSDFRRPVRKRMTDRFVTRSGLAQLEKRKKQTAAELSKINFNASSYPEYNPAQGETDTDSGVQPFTSH